MQAENCYEILGIDPDTDDEEVKQAFRELAKHYHPDRNPDDTEAERRFKLVNTAYESLKDASRRKSYDEWLAFSAGRQKTERRQRGRLAAIVALLLLGPSAVLYGVVMSGGTSFFESSNGSSGTVLTAQTEPDAVKPETAPGAAKSEDQAKIEESVTEGVADQTVNNSYLPDQYVSEDSENSNLASRPDETEKVQTTASLNSEEAELPANQQPIEPDDQETPAPKDISANQSDNDAEAESTSDTETSDYTNTIPKTAEDESSDIAGTDATPKPSSDQTVELSPDDEAANEGGAVASARLLARLKEPGESLASTEDASPIPANSTPLPERSQDRDSQGRHSRSSDTFSDCDFCPLMSVAKKPVSDPGEAKIAISLTEITVSQWNLCVEDGICTPYRSGRSEPSAPVAGLSLDNARNYAEWLSDITDESYRIVMPLGGSENQKEAAEAENNCEGNENRRRLRGWDWLEDKPDPKCEQRTSNRSPKQNDRGFRVARQLRSDG